MEQMRAGETVARVRKQLEEKGYGKTTIRHFISTTNQLLKFMDSEGVEKYSTDVGINFMRTYYAYNTDTVISHVNAERLRHLRKLSEFQLHGTIITKKRKRRDYDIPEGFRIATDAFLAYRRFMGIVERNMSATSLYLERFFDYLTSQKIVKPEQITGTHIHGYLRFITGFTNQSKDHMMRTVRQFMGFCYKNDAPSAACGIALGSPQTSLPPSGHRRIFFALTPPPY